MNNTDNNENAYGYSYSNSKIHRFLLQVWPNYYYFSSFVALFCVLYLLKKIHWTLLLPLLHPYYLLLIFTATKEQLIFIGLFFIFAYSRRPRKKSRWASVLLVLGALPLLSMRKVYIPFFIASFFEPVNRIKQVKIVYFFGMLLVGAVGFNYSHQISSGIEYLQARSSFAHIGRDYFPGLCLTEKANTISFISCWASTRLGIVIHEQFFSFNYFVHLGFLYSFWFVVYLALKLGRPFGLMLIMGMLAYHLLGSWWGPVQGAAERYFAPILWCVYLLALGRVLRSGCPRKMQWKFRTVILKRKLKFRLSDTQTSEVSGV